MQTLSPQLLPRRFQSLLTKLSKRIWTSRSPVTIAHEPGGEVITTPAYWGRLFETKEFRLRIEKGGGGPRYLNWQDQAEATLYADGKPWFGFDVAHRFCQLPDDCDDLVIKSTCVQSAIWHPDASGFDPRGSCLEGAWVMQRDDVVWDAWHDLVVLYELLLRELGDKVTDLTAVTRTRPPLPNLSYLGRSLLAHLSDAADAYDLHGAEAVRDRLRQAYRELPPDGLRMRCSLVGHAHIDLVWVWTRAVGEAKTVHTFTNSAYYLDRYPEATFAHSSPVCYETVERDEPALYERVQGHLKNRRWEMMGGSYVESDTQIACGEALARSFIVGQEEFVRISGKPSTVGWLPDCFGFSGALPQIMRQCGLETFFTSKLAWNSLNRFPHTSFIWRGTDGTEIPVHNCREPIQFYNGQATIREIHDGEQSHDQAAVHPEYLLPVGYGDGGGGVTDEMCERARRLQNLSGLPQTEWSLIGDFFERLKTAAPDLPTWDGEMYLEAHRAVLTTNRTIKKLYRRAERAMLLCEAAAAVTGAEPPPIEWWKDIIFVQFHDFVTGASINDVYRQEVPRLEALVDQITDRAAEHLASADGEACVFNPLPVPRIHRTLDASGAAIRAKLPPLAGTPLSALTALDPAPPVTATERSLSNGLVDVALDANGSIQALSVEGRAISIAEPLNALVVHADAPLAFEAWDTDQQALRLGVPQTEPCEITLQSEGDACAEIRVTRRIGTASHVTTIHRLRSGAKVLEIDYKIDWHEEHQLLKAHFATGYTGRQARFGSVFGSVRRPQRSGDPAWQPMWEVPASRWVVVTDDSESDGLFVVTEDNYGFSCVDGDLAVSLLRSALITGEADGFTNAMPHTLRDHVPESLYTDQGQHTVRLAIGRFEPGASRSDQPATLAETLFTPPVPYYGAAIAPGLLSIDGGESLAPAWGAKPLGAGRWLLRLHETLGRTGQAQLRLRDGWRASRTDLSEADPKPIEGDFAFRPYEIVSLIIEPVCAQWHPPMSSVTVPEGHQKLAGGGARETSVTTDCFTKNEMRPGRGARSA